MLVCPRCDNCNFCDNCNVSHGRRNARSKMAPPASLRDWLVHSACLDRRILDKTIEKLEAEECFTVADLAVLRGLPRFGTVFTEVSRQKVADALDAAALHRKPLSLDDSAPSWLTEAGERLRNLDLSESRDDGAPNVDVASLTARRRRRNGGSSRRREDSAAFGAFELQLPLPAASDARASVRPLRTSLVNDESDEEVRGVDGAAAGSASERASRSRKKSPRRRRAQSARGHTEQRSQFDDGDEPGQPARSPRGQQSFRGQEAERSHIKEDEPGQAASSPRGHSRARSKSRQAERPVVFSEAALAAASRAGPITVSAATVSGGGPSAAKSKPPNPMGAFVTNLFNPRMGAAQSEVDLARLLRTKRSSNKLEHEVEDTPSPHMQPDARPTASAEESPRSGHAVVSAHNSAEESPRSGRAGRSQSRRRQARSESPRGRHSDQRYEKPSREKRTQRRRDGRVDGAPEE